MSAKGIALFLRVHYLGGEQVKLYSLKETDERLSMGDMGTLVSIDDDGGIHVTWDKGFETVLTPGVDDFRIKEPKIELLRLYMPLCAEWADDDYAHDAEEGESLSDNQILNYMDAIQAAMVRNTTPEEFQRGIMRWYSKNDTVNIKVKAVRFNVEERDGKLWGVAECGVVGALNSSELSTLKEYIAGQASDGWGEGFEQRAIQTGEGEIYVHLWDFGDWDIQTEEERFSPKVADGLPSLCFSTLPSTGELIVIKRGEAGYYLSDWSTGDPAANKELADFNNQKLGVTYAQRMAMECGSMHGWQVPGADPASYMTEPVEQEETELKMEM